MIRGNFWIKMILKILARIFPKYVMVIKIVVFLESVNKANEWRMA